MPIVGPDINVYGTNLALLVEKQQMLYFNVKVNKIFTKKKLRAGVVAMLGM